MNKRSLALTVPVESHPPVSHVEEVERIFYEDGFRKGSYEHGEGCLDRLIAEDNLLPEISVEHVIALGLAQVSHLLQPLLAPFTVYTEMKQALVQRIPLSVVRLGDGELLALAHDKVLSSALVQKEGPFLKYAGFDIPDHEYREQLAAAVRSATFVGIPTKRAPNFHGLLRAIMRAYHLQAGHMHLTYSTINYLLAQQGYLFSLMESCRVLIVGNIGAALAEILGRSGIVVSGVISPVNGVRDVSRILDQVSLLQNDYDLALIAAGIPAVILSQRIAEQFGKVTLDFGHLADKMVSGEAAL